LRDWWREFKQKLTAQLLIEPKCKGVRLAEWASFDYELGSESKQKRWINDPHWLLTIDFVPSIVMRPKQKWTMTLTLAGMTAVNISPAQGEGTPAEIAAAACAIVTVQGAEVQN
jgi:hypothetical protein